MALQRRPAIASINIKTNAAQLVKISEERKRKSDFLYLVLYFCLEYFYGDGVLLLDVWRITIDGAILRIYFP